MTGLLEDARARGYAVPAFCVWNAETILCVLRAADGLQAPAILMNGPGEFALVGPREMGAIASALVDGFDVTVALHLDHGNSLSQVAACLDAGYTSVMLDYSARPFGENVSAMRQVVAMARSYGATVEGELGVVGRVSDAAVEGGDRATLTDPAEACQFVAQTGIDALAVAIGNAHGIYPGLPRLDFDRLAEISKAVATPLVLHGGSGTPDEDLRTAISLGVAKVNVASAQVKAARDSLLQQWADDEGLWTPTALAVSMGPVEQVVREWIHRTGADGG